MEALGQTGPERAQKKKLKNVPIRLEKHKIIKTQARLNSGSDRGLLRLCHVLCVCVGWAAEHIYGGAMYCGWVSNAGMGQNGGTQSQFV